MSGPAITDVAVVGAGTMGSGIALACVGAGMRVRLIDTAEAGLQRGRDLVAIGLASGVRRARLSQADADAQAAGITYGQHLEVATGADLVIEAVYEDLGLKQSVAAALDQVMPPDRLIATNTSTLSVTEIARATAHPGRVAGLHFFSPAHVMKLLEIVRGDDTTPETLAVARTIATRLGKVAVVAGDAFGFIGNRMMLDGYFREAEHLLLEGATPAQVDGALERFGFAMGPHRVADLGGLDVSIKARRELLLREPRPGPYFVVCDRLGELGRLGQKTGAGFYRYAPGSRDAQLDPAVDSLIEGLSAEHGIPRRPHIEDAEIVERCVLSLVHVGEAVLEARVAASASDIDTVWLNGYGFPRAHGGPMAYADRLGLDHVAQRIRHYHGRYGHYWQPGALIEQLAATGGRLTASDGRCP